MYLLLSFVCGTLHLTFVSILPAVKEVTATVRGQTEVYISSTLCVLCMYIVYGHDMV